MILSVTAAAIFSAVMLQFTQKSALQEIVKLAAGMVMILALLTPLSRLRLPSLTAWFSQARQSVDAQTARAQAQNEQIAQSSMADAVSRYIREQAETLGAVCRVQTTLETAEDETLQIASVTVKGTLTEEQQRALTDCIAQDCGVSRQQIRFTEE